MARDTGGQFPVLLVGSFLSSRGGVRSVGEELSLRLALHGWPTIETSHSTGRALRLVDMLRSVVAYRRQYRVAYVEVYSGLAFVWAELVVRLLKSFQKTVVLALHGGGLVEFAQANPSRVRRLLNQGSRVVTPSLFLQAGLAHYCSSIRWLPNAVDSHAYPFRPRRNPRPSVIWLRAFHEIYQPELAVRVLERLLQDFRDAQLTMIGPDKSDGSLNAALQTAKVLGLQSRISIVGPICKTDVPAWLDKGDIFLNTTLFESFGISVLEAALSGLPIVSTNVGELQYLWENKKTAMLVPPDDAGAMADAITVVLSEPGLAESLSNNARQKAEQFDWSVVLPQWERLFLETANA